MNELNITKRSLREFFGLKIMREGKVYIRRWHIIPRNRGFNIYLHKTMLSDREMFHDHPWNNISIVLWGGYVEVQPDNWLCEEYALGARSRIRVRGDIIRRTAEQPHYLLQPLANRPCWTLFITGRLRRTWGFYTKSGWFPHHEVVEVVDGKSQLKDSIKRWL